MKKDSTHGHILKEQQLICDALDNSLIAFDIVDDQGKFIYVNQAYVDLWGYDSADEIIGTSAALHCADPTVPEKIISTLKLNGECDIEFPARRKDGTNFTVHMWARKGFDSEGKEVYPTTSIDITERVEAEKETRLLQKRISFLSDATKIFLADPFSVDLKFKNLASLVVQEVADWCVFDIYKKDQLSILASSHRDPSKKNLAAKLRELYPPSDKINIGPYMVVRTGRTEIVPVISPETIQAFAQDEQHLKLLKELGLRSYLCVPLTARGKTLGAMTLVSVDPERVFDQRDVEMATELAHRAALSLDNSILFDQYRKAEERLDLAQRAAQIGTFEWDITHDKLYWTPQLEALYGLPQGSFEGSFEKWRETVFEEDLPGVEKQVEEAVKKEGSLHAEFRIKRTDGEIRWILSRGDIFREENGSLKMIGINLDITERKHLEEDLQQAVRARDDFISICSHELKTPVTAMKLQFQVVARQLDKKNTSVLTHEATEKRIILANNQLDRMTRLIEQMLDVSRIAAGKLKVAWEDLDLKEVTKEVLEIFEEQFSGLNIPFHFDSTPDPAIVNGDRIRLEQVVSNLLMNAVKYGGGRPVKVIIKTSDTKVLLEVKDHGIGIKKENLERIFGRYERAMPNISGLGLGLYISRQIVESHQGRIWVESEFGSGSTFYVELPKKIKEN